MTQSAHSIYMFTHSWHDTTNILSRSYYVTFKIKFLNLKTDVSKTGLQNSQSISDIMGRSHCSQNVHEEINAQEENLSLWNLLSQLNFRGVIGGVTKVRNG